jgi:CHASE2 domain-containing sensor protein
MGSSATKTISLRRNRAFRLASALVGGHGGAAKDALEKSFSKSALVGAALAVLCGLLLWGTPLGDGWVNASYDCLFRFGSRSVTNRVALVLMDDESDEQLHQKRGAPWDRALHAQLLKKLADDKSSLVVFDIHFKSAQTAETDSALAHAIRQHGRVVLMADILPSGHPGLDKASIWPPQELFLKAAAGYGVGHADPDTLQVARRHWPFFAPGEGDFRSLGWVAAEKFGARLDPAFDKQWLRYYGENGAWEAISYHLALAKPPGFFRDKIVFIGSSPEKSDPGLGEPDKFLTPYTLWNRKAVGGVEIMATTFLNLVNGDWLRRPPAWMEAALLTLTGILIGGGLCQLKTLPAVLAASGIALAVMLAFVSMSYFSNYWFPWLVIAGGQTPCALAWAWVSRTRQQVVFIERFPGYTTEGEPLGEGAYGKVWLARNATGQWQALKEIERAKFPNEYSYEREFRGITSYKPISNQHLGLLHIDHVNRNDQQGYFYYVMELGDPLDPDWQQKGEPYRPRDLASLCRQSRSGRLLPLECIRIGIQLLAPLDFLHQQGLVHRDIKPSNIVFVNGQPKLADVGLVRKAAENATWVGTESYMPPPPEPPGTPQADIYAMGLVLFVISTGRQPSSFPELPTMLVEIPEFMRLNEIICKACQPATGQRYASAGEMLMALRAAQREIDRGATRKI